MASRRRSRSPRASSRSAPVGDPLAGPRAQPDTHCHRPGRMRPGARRISRISRPATAASPEDPAVDEVRPERAHRGRTRRGSRPAARGASGRGRRRRRATRRSAAARPASMHRAGTDPASWPATRPGDPLDQPLALGDLANERRRGPRSGAPGMPGTTVGASAGQRPAAASDAAMHSPARASQSWPMHCGDGPVRLPAGQRERRRRGAARRSRSSASAERRRAGRRWPRPCRGRHGVGPRGGPR